jgi:hypothetical protein
MSGDAATDQSLRRPLVRAMRALLLISGLAAASSVQAQSSSVCQFAVATLAATELELISARKSYRKCARDSRRSCKIELGRVQELQQRVNLAQRYLDRYCMR